MVALGGRSQSDALSHILKWGYFAPQLQILSDYWAVLLFYPLEIFSFNKYFSENPARLPGVGSTDGKMMIIY